jgi:acyl-CoA synthetase (AMP-forming)/AMP-acid ligase II
MMTVDEFLGHWAQSAPDRMALCESGRQTSYADLDEVTARMSGALARAGLMKGDRIAWLGKNSDDYFKLFYGAARLGVVIVPVGWRLAPPEMTYIINDCCARLLFVGYGFESVAEDLGPDLLQVEHRVNQAMLIEWLTGVEPLRGAAVELDDAALQLYTSGTTGVPKGAVLSNRNLFALRLTLEAAGFPGAVWDNDEVALVAMPCSHIGGTGLAVLALAAGAGVHILPEFTAAGVINAVRTGAVTRFFVVPAALQMILAHPLCAATDFSRLKYISYGAAPIPLELLRECMQVFKADFLQAYGMTETTGSIVALWPEDHNPEGNHRMRGQGRALPGVELKIVDDAGVTLRPDEVGELWTRSSNNMLGYWHRAEATASTITADGWLKTGDAACLDEDGYLYIHDRMKDMIITGGENVYPAEVESAIYGHPAIAEVGVIGVPDDRWGEAVKAICVAKPGFIVDEADVIAWARTRIAAFKAPKSVDVVSSLPRNAGGKILRKDLRAPYWSGRQDYSK